LLPSQLPHLLQELGQVHISNRPHYAGEVMAVVWENADLAVVAVMAMVTELWL